MANDINMVVLVGRLTRDPEMRYTSTGLALCRFSLAVNRKKRSGDNWVDEVSFVDISIWGRQAEALNNYLNKGKQVAVQGELRQSRWEQDGQKRSRIEVVANNVQLLGDPSSQSGGARPAQPSSKPAYNRQPAANSYAQKPQNDYAGPEGFDDDIPF
jgi:single-strand DNA-binding protein